MENTIMTTYTTLPDTTRVWIYQSNQPLPDTKIPEVKIKITQFVKNWVSHKRALRAFGDILHNQFVVLMVDESQAGASGCSIDKSVNFLKMLQAEYGVDLFDRMVFTYQLDGKIHSSNRSEFAQLYRAGTINDQTPVFDNLVNNKGDFDRAWIKPLGSSWHKRMV